ncbi:methyltransferase domain-containing protein [Actinoplanes sp. NPDC026619]|uniref:class I SAM-dependent methyltransferase n=1 Tax=Actinoplanes sp. NPDC026619 TaxID=3155798 RepID=UPI003409C632
MGGDVWGVGSAYEAYVGRWSRPVAASFVAWLAVAPGRRWLDAGCGTGALTGAIRTAAAPAQLVGADMSLSFLGSLHGAAWVNADAAALPLAPASFGAVVSGLALNFVPEPARAVAEFTRVATPGATVASYVWDYADGMQLMRWFWDAARAVDPAAAEVDEAVRFPICSPTGLAAAWTDAGLHEVETRAITVPTLFTDFDDYWQPFLGGQGAAPAYLARLAPHRRWEIRDLLDARLPRRPDGSIALTATAWAVRGHAA